MVKIVLTIICLTFLSFGNLSAQAISAKAFTDKTEYQVGDYINYTIEVSHHQELRLLKPALSDYLKDVEIIRTDEPIVQDSDGTKKIIYQFILSKYDSSDVIIPAIPVLYNLGKDTTSMRAMTNPVQFVVRTLQVVTSTEIKDVKPPIQFPMDLLMIILILLGVIILIAVATYFYKRHQKKKQKKIERKTVYVIPPHVKALTELHALEEKKLWQQGMIKEYHSEITQIIRSYFEDRFKILALESTTTEIMQQLKRVVITDNIFGTVNEFLKNADLVKFAKFKPHSSVNEEMMQQALEIVENTVPANTENERREKVNV